MKLSFLLAVLLFASGVHAGGPSIHYTLAMPNPTTHLFEVTVDIGGIASDSALSLALPVWRPGRYTILDLASGVQEFSAETGGRPVEWERVDKTTWRVGSRGAAALTIRYKVFANEFNIRTRGLNDQQAFVDESALFMYVEPYRSLPVRLSVIPFKSWHVTTGLDEVSRNEFTAPDYDSFIDYPLEIGTQKDFDFAVDGTPFVLSMAGDGNWQADTLIRDISRIVHIEKEMWGSFPFKKYYFLIECSTSAGGGTEHLNSTIIQVPPFIFRNPDSYKGWFLNTIAHEFFHTWNVKQLRPAGIHPFDFTKENYSREFWIAEGMTSYFADLIMMRAGFVPVRKFVDRLASIIATDRSRPGNRVESVADASFNAWEEAHRPYQQTFNAGSDIYERGAMVSGALDLELREQTGNKATLEGVMREMYRRFPLSGRGYTLDDLSATIREAGGWDPKQFFADFIYGTTPIPWEKLYSYAGLVATCTDTVAKPWVGVSVYDNNGVARIGTITAGSPAYSVGLESGDDLLAMNGIRARSSEFSDRIGELKPGDEIVLTIFHEDHLRAITLKLGTAPKLNYKLTETDSPTELQKSIYADWLKTGWPEKKR